MEEENGENLAKNTGTEKLLKLDCKVSQFFSMRLSGGTGSAEATAGLSEGAKSP